MIRTNQGGWWHVKWLWAVPVGCGALVVGCLGLLVVIALVLGVSLGGVLAIVFGAMKSSGAYQLALNEVRQSSAVVQVLGQPMQAGWFVSGSVQVRDGSGKANISFNVKGPKGSGRVFARAVKVQGIWQLTYLAVRVARTGQLIVLVGGESEETEGEENTAALKGGLPFTILSCS